MPVQSLAKVFGPTIVGYSSVEAEPMKMFAETAKQAKVSLVKQHCIDAVYVSTQKLQFVMISSLFTVLLIFYSKKLLLGSACLE